VGGFRKKQKKNCAKKFVTENFVLNSAGFFFLPIGIGGLDVWREDLISNLPRECWLRSPALRNATNLKNRKTRRQKLQASLLKGETVPVPHD
jgi:hypothetical protein